MRAQQCGCSMAVTRAQSVQIPSPSNALKSGMEGSTVWYMPINSPMRTHSSDAPNLSAYTQSPDPPTAPKFAIRVTNTRPNHNPSPHLQRAQRTVPPRSVVDWTGSICPDGLKQIPASVTDIGFPGDIWASHVVMVPLGYPEFLPYRQRCSR